MKGVVFNLLEQAVVDRHGADAWDDLLDAADLTGAYTSLGSYPDEEMAALVQTASAMLQVPPAGVLQWFGRSAMPLLAQRYPAFFANHQSARSFLLSVNDIIHPEVRKLYSGAGCPNFEFGSDEQGRTVVGYRSSRQLCHLAHGFAEGAADHYGERVEVEHVRCMLHGDVMCNMALRWH